MGDLAVKANEFMELKRLLLEGQERQHIIEDDLGKAMNTIGIMQEVMMNLIREIAALHESMDDDEDIYEGVPDFLLKNGERLEIN